MVDAYLTSDIECDEGDCFYLIDNNRYTDEELTDTDVRRLCDWHITEANLEEQADIYNAWIGGE
jgi:hypothetical protein